MVLTFYKFILGVVLSFFFVRITLPLLRKNLVDIPNHRSSHQMPVPRGGGLAFVIVGTILQLMFETDSSRWIPVICLPLACTGLIDDYKDVSPLFRYIIQLCTALILVLVARFSFTYWEIPIYVLIVTAIINFFNFMDGLDGMVAACSIPIFAVCSSWSLSGSIFGFLLWNWSPAKVFMGDVGSTFLGAVFAGYAFNQASAQDAFSLLLLGFPLFADTSICLLRRILDKQNIFHAHKQHLYQRLNQGGWSHSKVSSLYLAGVILILFVREQNSFALMLMVLLLELMIGYLLDRSVAVKFKGS